MRNLKDAGSLAGKKILLRTDFDVPVSEKGEIQESFRIKKQKEALDYLVEHGAQVVLVAHISAVKSFTDLLPQLKTLLSQEINFIKSVDEISAYLEHYSGPALLDNVRQNPGEEKNDPDFAKQLAAGFDLYVNNAFAVSHRNHASVAGVPKIIPGYAGPVVEAEVAELSEVMSAPAEGKVVIIGGAKASTKVPVIKNFIDKAEAILTGGVVANDILKQKGQDMGSSIVDEDLHLLLMNLDLNNNKLHIPQDFIVFDNKILDIGDQTMKNYLSIIQNAKTIIWNGPMGLFENSAFAKGTEVIAQAVAASPALTVIGGGDTIAAVDSFHLLEKFKFVSTGGGAMLSYLAGDSLPGLEALK